MAVLHGDGGLVPQQHLVGQVLPQGQPVPVGLLHQAHVRPDADPSMLHAAGGTGDLLQHLLLPGSAVRGHRKGQRRVPGQIGLHALAAHDALDGVPVAHPLHRDPLQDPLAVLIISLHTDDPVQPVQSKLQRGIQIDADIGHGHPQHGIGADAQEYREHGPGGAQRQAESGTGQASILRAPLLKLSGVPQEFFCGGLQLFACPHAVKRFPDSVLLPHHKSPPSASFSMVRPLDRSE